MFSLYVVLIHYFHYILCDDSCFSDRRLIWLLNFIIHILWWRNGNFTYFSSLVILPVTLIVKVVFNNPELEMKSRTNVNQNFVGDNFIYKLSKKNIKTRKFFGNTIAQEIIISGEFIFQILFAASYLFLWLSFHFKLLHRHLFVCLVFFIFFSNSPYLYE